MAAEQSWMRAQKFILFGGSSNEDEHDFVYLFHLNGDIHIQSPFIGTVPNGHLKPKWSFRSMQNPRLIEYFFPMMQLLSASGASIHLSVIPSQTDPTGHLLGAAEFSLAEQSWSLLHSPKPEFERARRAKLTELPIGRFSGAYLKYFCDSRYSFNELGIVIGT